LLGGIGYGIVPGGPRISISRRSCTRVTVRGTLTRAGNAGADSFILPDRIGRLQLAPASFLLFAAPTAGGDSGKQQRATFQIVRKGRRPSPH